MNDAHCARCGQPIGTSPFLEMPDGLRYHGTCQPVIDELTMLRWFARLDDRLTVIEQLLTTLIKRLDEVK